MSPPKATLAIYGIQDRNNPEYPLYVHDHSICLMQGGRVEKLLQLERKTRRKRDNKLYRELHPLLKEAKMISPDHYDVVFVDNVVGRAFLSPNGQIRFEAPLNNLLKSNLEKGRCWWYDREIDGYVLNHELAHIFSCLPFFGNFKENSLLIHFDGGASLSNFSVWTFRDNKIEPVESHWDLKYLTSLYNANALAFAIIGAKIWDQNSVPGKMMGFASYGTYRPEYEKWLKEKNFFRDIWKKKSVFWAEAQKKWKIKLTSFDQHHPFLQDIMATFQQIFQRDLLQKLKDLKASTGCTQLYYSGGCALNIVANSEIISEKIFDEVYIPPCCDDSGLALGAAAFMEWKKHGRVKKHSPYLNNWGIENYRIDYSKVDIEQTARLLMEGKVIGICNGYGEVGPRALGNRSIIALANNARLAQKVSMDHKGREWYRPVAPILLGKNAGYFTGENNIHSLCEYMLLDVKVLSEKKEAMEGTVHVDGTARMQTISRREQNPFIFDLLSFLDTHYNQKALINTSFNIKGEPIVHNLEDAVRSAKNMKLDAVVLNGKVEVL